jgi:putative tryptophan/tyrosine transport system substrate-binding protein
MDRRALVAALAAALPFAARAQQRAMPLVGVLFDGTAAGYRRVGYPGLVSGLTEAGLVEGRTVAIELLAAEGNYQQIPVLARELVGLKVDAVLAAGGTTPAIAAATATIPIVFTSGTDPVQQGWVASLNRPGGNVTGVAFLSSATAAKQLDLLHRIVPGAERIAFLTNPTNPRLRVGLEGVLAAAKRLGLTLDVVNASKLTEIDDALADIAARHFDALLISDDPLFGSERERVGEAVTRHGIPALTNQREFAAAGGLASYGASVRDASRQAGLYVVRILKGAKPADLPVQQSDKFDLVLNLKTAKTLGIEIPPTILAIADEVIE